VVDLYSPAPSRRRPGLGARLLAVGLVAAGLAAAPAQAQRRVVKPAAQPAAEAASDLVTLDFDDVELSVVIDTISRMTGRNFIYDDRVRGRVTIVSPSPIPVEQAFAVFESVLQVKGFTTVTTPGGAIKVVPVREAKESSIETVKSSRRPPNRDRFVTRLIPLNYIDAESIVTTLKPLVSKDAAMAAYAPTNTVILTESASNIRRLISILESIDVETYKEELAVIEVEYADAATLAEQVSEIYGADVSSTGAASPRRSSRRRTSTTPEPAGATGRRAHVRILTDERTNSLLVLAARQQLEEVRRLVAKLDVPVTGGGRIHVYYLKHANAEELGQTLGGLVSGRAPTAPTGGTTATGTGAGAAARALRASVAGLGGGVTVTADPATNALIIQASQEGFNTLRAVIEQLDIVRPQVLVEALIMEVDVTNNMDLGVSALIRYINGDTEFAIATATDAAAIAATGGAVGGAGPLANLAAQPLVAAIRRNTTNPDADGNPTEDGTVIDGIIRASAGNGDINIISAPHILTSDNEQAEIRVGDNIPIVTSRVQSATGQTVGLSSSVNVERQDIGVTLRVTPQITEGDTLRLEIFQEITNVNEALSDLTGDPESVGVALSNRRVENTVVVADGETVVIGGLIGDANQDVVTKVPWLGDIPVLGWLFKSTSTSVVKQNLLVFLTPRIVRTAADLEHETIRKREEFRDRSGEALELSEDEVETEAERFAEAQAAGLPYMPDDYGNPVRRSITGHSARYPLERMREIERQRLEEQAEEEARRVAALRAPEYYLQTAIFGDAEAAAALLTDLIDSGHDGTLVSEEKSGAVLYEIHLGPYADLEEARRMSDVVRRSHGLSPAVIVVEPVAEE
jgi:general secretion pathway protein D